MPKRVYETVDPYDRVRLIAELRAELAEAKALIHHAKAGLKTIAAVSRRLPS